MTAAVRKRVLGGVCVFACLVVVGTMWWEGGGGGSRTPRALAKGVALPADMTQLTSEPTSRAPAAATPRGTPTASTAPGGTAAATVGALFRNASGRHSCTASVVASRSRDTLLTAAHCLGGSAAGMTFVPAYRNGSAPDGTWRVTAAYVTAAWQDRQDPTADFAVLVVAPHTVDGHAVDVADVTGSEAVGGPPQAGTTVTVVAYNAGSGDQPIMCAAPVSRDAGYPSFDCHGFIGGSSGSPWLTFDATGRATVHGVIGGLAQGGCHEYRSYSAVFDGDVDTLLRRADAHAEPDVVVRAAPPDC